jgi:hypothetical protein
LDLSPQVPRSFYSSNEGFAGLITPTGNDHVRALLGEGDGGGATNAGQGASDQDYWVALGATR